MTIGVKFLAEKLVGDRLHHLEIYVGGLSLLTGSQIRLNVYNRFCIDGFHGGNPMSMIGKRIEAIKEERDHIAMMIGDLVINVGSSDDHWTGPEAWAMSLPDGTFIVERGEDQQDVLSDPNRGRR